MGESNELDGIASVAVAQRRLLEQIANLSERCGEESLVEFAGRMSIASDVWMAAGEVFQPGALVAFGELVVSVAAERARADEQVGSPDQEGV